MLIGSVGNLQRLNASHLVGADNVSSGQVIAAAFMISFSDVGDSFGEALVFFCVQR